MHRFFVNNENIKNNTIEIIGNEHIHLSKVLRAKKDEKITVCDDSGIEYTCVILKIESNTTYVKIIDKNRSGNEPKVKIALFQSIPKSDKMDGIIKRAVELGISEIFPIITDRTIVKLNQKKIEKRVSRWQKIAMEASKQCKRSIIPKINEPIKFLKGLELFSSKELSLLFFEDEKNVSIKDLNLANIRTVGIFIGPEGGFSKNEIILAKKKKVRILTLGNRILRTETASTAALSILMHEFGELS